MRRPVLLAGLALAVVPLAGCADYYGDRYGYSRPYYSSSYYPRSYGWYDGYYGSVYDGYWGRGDTYYYRLHQRDRWRRDDGRHFHYGTTAPSTRYYRYDRAAPTWRDDGRRGRGHVKGHDKDRGRGHDRHDD